MTGRILGDFIGHLKIKQNLDPSLTVMFDLWIFAYGSWGYGVEI